MDIRDTVFRYLLSAQAVAFYKVRPAYYNKSLILSFLSEKGCNFAAKREF